MPLLRQCAELLAHVHNTNNQSHWPEIGKKMADKAKRPGGAERFPEPAWPNRSAVDLVMIDSDDRLLTALALYIVQTAKQPDANPLYRLQTVPGIGKMFSVVRLSDIHVIHRVPRGQAFGSSCRLVKGAQASAGER